MNKINQTESEIVTLADDALETVSGGFADFTLIDLSNLTLLGSSNNSTNSKGGLLGLGLLGLL